MKLHRNYINSILLFITLIWIISSQLSAQELDYKLDKPQKLFIGTPFKIHVDINSAASDSIFTTQNDTLDIFILKDLVSSENIEDDTKITSLSLTYQPFDTGEFAFPELEFAVKTTKDSLHILKTREFIVNIESVITDSTETIKDIAPPIKVNLKFLDYFIPIILVIVIILIIKFIIKYIKQIKKSESKPEIVDERPAYVIALELLNSLKNDELLKKDDFLNFYFRLSFILRLFIELNYKINSVEMTTSEIRSNLSLDDHKEKSEILQFLNKADLIKFAKAVPSGKDSENAIAWLEQYLKSFEIADKVKEPADA